jgi:parallel beta-helix repeat protein
VKGSADAGIYVGQSSNIVVRNNIAEKNVAGIEIENSMNADVYGNTATGNTGGILIFDLPIGNGLYGSGVRIFNNTVTDNNAPNFATASDFAGGVHIVPPGTGVIILSTSDVEIFDNTITGHQTTSVALSSYILADDKVLQVPNQDVGGADGDSETPTVMTYGDIATYSTQFLDGWSPVVRSINIHDNTIVPGTYNPKGSLIRDIILGYTLNGNKVPDILYDGIGELMAQIPASGGGLFDIAYGIDQLAQALDQNQLESDGARIPDLTEFGQYQTTDYVCASDNGDVNQAAVFATNPAEATFVNGEPQPQLLQNDDSMTCGGNTGKVAFIGAAATATISGTDYGCGVDDQTSVACASQ